MLKQETYEHWAEGFATSIGVAHTIRFGDGGLEPMEYKKLNRELTTNRRILKTIEDGKYNELQREIYRIGSSDRRLSEGTIIKRAFDKIYGKEKPNTKSTKVL